jgi:anti-sigma B factor antagonist
LEQVLTNLAEKGMRTVTIDLRDVGFIDSSGLRALVVAHKALQDQGGSLVVANPSASTARLLEVTGLDGLFDIET